MFRRDYSSHRIRFAITIFFYHMLTMAGQPVSSQPFDVPDIGNIPNTCLSRYLSLHIFFSRYPSIHNMCSVLKSIFAVPSFRDHIIKYSNATVRLGCCLYFLIQQVDAQCIPTQFATTLGGFFFKMTKSKLPVELLPSELVSLVGLSQKDFAANGTSRDGPKLME